jgi:hypothetical protein
VPRADPHAAVDHVGQGGVLRRGRAELEAQLMGGGLADQRERRLEPVGLGHLIAKVVGEGLEPPTPVAVRGLGQGLRDEAQMRPDRRVARRREILGAITGLIGEQRAQPARVSLHPADDRPGAQRGRLSGHRHRLLGVCLARAAWMATAEGQYARRTGSASLLAEGVGCLATPVDRR